jgi:hypothetical protein
MLEPMIGKLKSGATLGLLVAIALWPVPSAAQNISASLTGEVRTEEGQPVPGAVIQARSTESGTTRNATSDEAGGYRLDSLSLGSWTVVARLGDGRMSVSRTVNLGLQQTVRLDFTVGGGLTERVTVTAERPLIDPMETAGMLRIDAGQAESLPLAGRQFTDLALLESSVRPSAPGDYFGERGSVFVINGQSGRSNSFLVDGLDNNDQTSGTALNSFFSQQVIQEFVLLTNQYSPEFGRASGGILNIVTRRGGNEAQWEAFAQGTSSRWNESGDFIDSLPVKTTSKGAVSRYQAGFTFSGPFKKDRAFYFLAYEHQESDDLIPYTGFEREDVGNLETTGGGRYLAPSRDDNLFFRTDFNLGLGQTLMVRLSADDRESSGVMVGGANTPEFGFRIEERDVALAATWTSILSPNVINEVRFLAAHSVFDQFANSDRPGVARPSGIFGGNALNQQSRGEDRIQIVENLTWRKGDHTFKFGFDVARSRTDVSAGFNPNGNFIYNYDFAFEPGDRGGVDRLDVENAEDPSAICNGEPGLDLDGDGMVAECANILSYPLIFTYIFGQPSTTLEDTKIGLFAQDRWKINSKFMLDYGLRYDISTYTLPAEHAVNSVIPNGGAGRDTDNIAPRLGFTLTPWDDGRMVIRGGAGIFYDKLVLGFPAVASITSGTRVGLFFPQGLTWEFNEDVLEEDGIDAWLPILELLADEMAYLVMRFSTGTELETPFTAQYNIGVDLGTGPHSAFRANVIRAGGYNLPLMKDLNPVSGLTPAVLADCTEENINPDLEPYEGLPCHLGDPETGSIAAIVTEGRSWYTGVDLSWRWQKEGSWFSAAYTWSKAEDMGFDPLKGGISLPPDSRNLSAERGRADGDRRHRLVISGNAPLPWMGLRASGVLQLSSGMPFNVTTGIDDNVDGILTDRPEGVGRNTGEDTPLDLINAEREKFNEEINHKESWTLDPVTSLREPGFFQVDFRIYRPFLFGNGRGKGEFFLQVFNLLDRENYGLIEGRATSRNFGRPITLAGPPRTIEIGLKVGY